MEKKKKRNAKGQVRCLNCFERFEPAYAEEKAKCPNCKMEWRLTWSSPTSVKVRGPVWQMVDQP